MVHNKQRFGYVFLNNKQLNKTALLLNIAIHLSKDNILSLSAGGMTVIYFQRKNGAIARLILVIEHLPAQFRDRLLCGSSQDVTKENSSISVWYS